MNERQRLTPLPADVARAGVRGWDAQTVAQLREDGRSMQREIQAEAAKMRALSPDELKARAR